MTERLRLSGRNLTRNLGGNGSTLERIPRNNRPGRSVSVELSQRTNGRTFICDLPGRTYLPHRGGSVTLSDRRSWRLCAGSPGPSDLSILRARPCAVVNKRSAGEELGERTAYTCSTSTRRYSVFMKMEAAFCTCIYRSLVLITRYL